MRIPWVTWIWPIFILLSTLAVTLTTFLFPGVGVRPFVSMGFLFIIPGMTVVRFFRLNEIAVEWMLALVLSFTIDAFVAGIILYAHQWSPISIISFLIGFCFSGAIAQLAIIRPLSSTIEDVVTSDLAKPLSSTIEDVVTSDLAKPLSSTIEDVVTVDLAKPLSSTIEDVVTVDLAKPLSSTSEEVMTIDLPTMEDPEDTQEYLAVLPKSHKLRREDTEEKTVVLEKIVVLEKTELSGKEA